MQTKTYNVYKFHELTDEQKEKAVNNLRDINIEDEWWDATFEDAKTIGLKITEFDIDRNRHATGSFIYDGETVARNILKEHGDTCNTYKTAKEYLAEYESMHSMGGETDDAEREKIDDEFFRSLLEDYSIMLQNEYEYQTSDEAIKETIYANDYDFTDDGEID